MKRSLLLLAVLALTACGITSPTGSKTPAQVAAQVCPPVQVTLSSLSGLVGLPPSVVADLAIANTVVGTVCGVGAVVTSGNLQAMLGQVVPALVAAVKASPISVEMQNQAILDLSVVQIILSGALALNPPVTGLGLGVSIAPAASSPGK